ncbi:hypothetical protein B0T25DRAFT_603209 [Lasiosphaeria hispida]|uniref:Peptidase S8/S53 domain-containing protein n=1 Tax=Lasiosphaeria hispida TaxID=260671 RepID=A0AAJ0HLC9_9PEZI|nr:hypothetical protein B0T25DRAFT_603209 [Lasiosphaeria hispida]
MATWLYALQVVHPVPRSSIVTASANETDNVLKDSQTAAKPELVTVAPAVGLVRTGAPKGGRDADTWVLRTVPLAGDGLHSPVASLIRNFGTSRGPIPGANISLHPLKNQAGIRLPWASSTCEHLELDLRAKVLMVGKDVIAPSNSSQGTGKGDQDHLRKPLRITRRSALSDLREVFRWLRAKNVRTIIEAIVIDHSGINSDEMIEEALGEFHVQEWDWKKVDLCTDVVSACSKEVRVVTLYSSGNNAVLKGWASDQGLACKEKFPKHVRLFIRLGSGTEGRRHSNILKFKKRVEKIKVEKRLLLISHGYNLSKDYVTVADCCDDGEVSYAEGLPTMKARCLNLEELALFLSAAPEEERDRVSQKKPVKIAIIDDGVDASLDIFKGKIAGGKSFCPNPTSADLTNAYYAPEGKHGTMMANLICRICQSQIKVSSAAKAIKWAVDCDVDIISMSWAVEANTNEKITLLKEALELASKANILLFCAISDQGSLSATNCSPKGDKVVRIGAATDTGVKMHTESGVGKPSIYESGSSFATALASGLGGLLLYCERLFGSESETSFRERTQLLAVLKMAASTSDQKFVRADTLVKWFSRTLRQANAAAQEMEDGDDQQAGAGATDRSSGLVTPKHASYKTEVLATPGAASVDAMPLSRMRWTDDVFPAPKELLSHIKGSESPWH